MRQSCLQALAGCQGYLVVKVRAGLWWVLPSLFPFPEFIARAVAVARVPHPLYI